MTLLIHWRGLAVWRLGVTATVTIGTVVAVGSTILNSLRQTRTLGPVLLRGRLSRGGRLVTDGRKRLVRWCLDWVGTHVCVVGTIIGVSWWSLALLVCLRTSVSLLFSLAILF